MGKLGFTLALAGVLIASATAPTAQPAPSTAATSQDRELTSPLWSRVPGANAADQFYPNRADREQVPGHAVVRCRVGRDGYLSLCETVQETPPGYGFGAAAMMLSRYYRLKTDPPKGSEIAGKFVRFETEFIPKHMALLEPTAGETKPMLAHWGRYDAAFTGSADYPEKALHAVVSGQVAIRCQVGANGEMVGCQVAKEDPAGWGFGLHALSAVRRMTLSRAALDGSPTVGRSLIIRVVFNVPCDQISNTAQFSDCPRRIPGSRFPGSEEPYRG